MKSGVGFRQIFNIFAERKVGAEPGIELSGYKGWKPWETKRWQSIT